MLGRVMHMPYQLFTPLDDLDLIQVGLLGDWDVYPEWFIGALTRACDRETIDTLVVRSALFQQTGLLETALRNIGCWARLPSEYREVINARNALSEMATTILWQYGRSIHDVCTGAGIEYAFLKGFAASAIYYDAPWERPFRDIDVIVPRNRATELWRRLTCLGFHAGRLDRRRKTIEPASTSEFMPDTKEGYELPPLWQLIPVQCDPETVHLLSKVQTSRLFFKPDGVWFPLSVEIHFALTAELNWRWDSGPIGAGAVAECYTLDLTSRLLFSIYKSYVDVVIFGKRSAGKLFGDAIRCARREAGRLDWQGLAARAAAYGLSAQFGYFLHHARQTYGLAVEAGQTTDPKDDFGQEPIDFGDFLPQILVPRRRFDFILR